MQRSLKRKTEEEHTDARTHTHTDTRTHTEEFLETKPRVRGERDDGPEATVRRWCNALAGVRRCALRVRGFYTYTRESLVVTISVRGGFGRSRLGWCASKPVTESVK